MTLCSPTTTSPMSSLRNKRIIYESDDTDDSSRIDRCVTSHSHKKRILCESDDNTDSIKTITKKRDDRTPTATPSVSKEVSVALSAAGSAGNSSNDEWDPDTHRNVMKGDLPTSKKCILVSADSNSAVRRSQRSAAISATKRLSIISQDAYFNYLHPEENIGSLESPHLLGQRSAQKHHRANQQEVDSGEEEDTGEDENEDEDEENYCENVGGADDASDEEASCNRKDKLKLSRSTNKAVSRSDRTNDIGNPTSSRSSTRVSSDRSQRLSAAKEVERKSKLREIRRPSVRCSALDAMATSEDEASGEESDENMDGKEDGDDEVRLVGALKQGAQKEQEGQQEKASQRGQRRLYSPSPSPSPSASQSQSRTQSSGSQRRHQPRSSCSGSSAFIRKEMMPERDTFFDGGGEDLDDFIVGSDEEREEQERERELVLREREKRCRRKVKEQKQREKEQIAMQNSLAKQTNEKEKVELDRIRLLHSQTKSRRRKIITEDDEDEGDDTGSHILISPHFASAIATPVVSDGKSEQQQQQLSSISFKVKLTSDQVSEKDVDAGEVGGGGEGEGDKDNEDSPCDESEDDESDEDTEDEDEDDFDGPMLYRRVDAMREEEEEKETSTSYIRKVESHPHCHLKVLK